MSILKKQAPYISDLRRKFSLISEALLVLATPLILYATDPILDTDSEGL